MGLYMRNRHQNLGHGQVIMSHSILWDVITYPWLVHMFWWYNPHMSYYWLSKYFAYFSQNISSHRVYFTQLIRWLTIYVQGVCMRHCHDVDYTVRKIVDCLCARGVCCIVWEVSASFVAHIHSDSRYAGTLGLRFYLSSTQLHWQNPHKISVWCLCVSYTYEGPTHDPHSGYICFCN